MAAGMVGLDEESLMRGTKRNIRLVARDSWLPEFLSWRELDADSYSRNGHPPKKLIFVRNSGEVEIRDWRRTPCRYGQKCKALQRGVCAFKHDGEDEVEIAAGSALRLRQIKQAFERRRQEKGGTFMHNSHLQYLCHTRSSLNLGQCNCG